MTETEMTYREAIRAALDDEMTSDSSVLLLGEDVAQAGGPFKTSEGLYEKFGGDRIINTPIAENGFTGVALGMARGRDHVQRFPSYSGRCPDRGVTPLEVHVWGAVHDSCHSEG